MVNQRKFNYYTLPDYDSYGPSYPNEANMFMNEGQYPPCPCQYQMAQSAFMNPAQPVFANQQMHAQGYQFPNPNLNPNINPNPNPGGETTQEQRMLQQFLNEDGQVDIQKMLQTIGQFADTVQQVSPVVKQINDIIRSFRA